MVDRVDEPESDRDPRVGIVRGASTDPRWPCSSADGGEHARLVGWPWCTYWAGRGTTVSSSFPSVRVRWLSRASGVGRRPGSVIGAPGRRPVGLVGTLPGRGGPAGCVGRWGERPAGGERPYHPVSAPFVSCGHARREPSFSLAVRGVGARTNRVDTSPCRREANAEYRYESPPKPYR